MLTLKLLRDDPEFVIGRLAVKNFEARPLVEKILELDNNRRSLQKESDDLLAQQKVKASQIGALMKAGRTEEVAQAKQEVAELKSRSAALLAQADVNNRELEETLVLLPNLPCAIVPEGKSAEDNLVVKMGGAEPVLPEGALPHWDLCKKYDIIDFDLGVKITGAGFPVYKGKGAKLCRRLQGGRTSCDGERGIRIRHRPAS